MKQYTRIIIVGYYDHANLGDEQYKETFEYMLDKYLPQKINYEILFIDCDMLPSISVINTDIIILGGGDILNYYFIDKIYDIFHNRPNKILAVSVGLPYSDILMNTNKLNIIDFIFIRTKKDINLFSRYFTKERIFYLPDISFYITRSSLSKKSKKNIIHNTPSIQNHWYNAIHQLKKQENKKKIIAFSLSRHIYNKQNPEYYQNIIQEISVFISFLIKSGYFIVLLPFNTSNTISEREHNLENDIFIHTDIMDVIHNKYSYISENILNIDFTLSTKEVLQIYDYVYVSIPMRFHACLFSIYKRIPILPLFTQKKIRNLLIDIQWTHFYELPKNDKDVPITICQKKIQNEFNNLLTDFHSSRELLNVTCNELFEKNLQTSVPKLIEIIQTAYPKNNTFINVADNKVLQIFNKLQSIAHDKGYADFRCIDNVELKQKLINVVNFMITGDFDSSYSYGLMEKMFHFSFNYNDEWKWIMRDWQEKKDSYTEEHYSNPNGLFNLRYIPQADKSGSHRSGWQYVYNYVEKLHNDNSTLYLDLYLDRTFHWKKDLMKMVDIIPYHNPWVGFIHHTFDQSFSTYNNHVMFQDPDFIASLNCCKGIFVLSDYLKIQIENIFSQQNINIPVFTLMHPTEIHNIPKFTLQKFIENKDKKIVNVGGWLRNIFTFYQLYIPLNITFSSTDILLNDKRSKSSFFYNLFHKCISFFQYTSVTRDTLRKVALKGKGMNNYYPSNELFPFIQPEDYTQILTENNKFCSQNNNELKNNWHKHLYEYLQHICNSVDVINSITNEEYDELLSNNIVFIHLIDASTVNTILECIARNTPIIVNNHPAVIELLGKDYPLYYDGNKSIYEISKEIEKKLNIETIKKTCKYMNKEIKEIGIDKFMLYFVDKMNEIRKKMQSV
jgi:polysaccharide pyruvyl transferase WcaK-like protein